ncbi:hypothetical protein GLGR_2795 [Leminorella grimontii ATCC 33999 = DSM 5078]|nr:hypothetical protein GLGR_2795 [Leminorella grimontii ATCC 33999 = DSM 5078]
MDLSSSNLFSLSRRLVIGAALSLSAFSSWAEDAPKSAVADTEHMDTLPLVQIKHTGTQYIPVPHVEKTIARSLFTGLRLTMRLTPAFPIFM